MVEYVYVSSGQQFRIPIKEDGSLGRPEFVKGWSTVPEKGKVKKPKPVKPVNVETSATIRKQVDL